MPRSRNKIRIPQWAILVALAFVLVVSPLATIWSVPVAESLAWTPLMATFWYFVGYFGPSSLYQIANGENLGPVELLLGGIGTQGLYGVLATSLYSLYVLA